MVAALLPALLLAAAPSVGAVAPDFTAKDSRGEEVTLSKLLEKGTVVLAFFPKAFTPGCTQQMQTFQRLHPDFEKAGAQVVAISTDDAQTLERFKKELKAPYRFIPDPDAKLAALYDVKKPVFKLASRVTFVVGPGRKVLATQSGGEAVEAQNTLQACQAPTTKP